MALHGKFALNNKDLAPLIIYGLGTYLAFSGNNSYRNRGGCTAVAGAGPIPAGKYWIVDRPSGGVLSRLRQKGSDMVVSASRRFVDRNEWFALYRDDGTIDDQTWVNDVSRGQFRLHPVGGSGISLGCITLPSRVEFLSIRHALLNTSPTPAGNSGRMAYGCIEVIAYGNACP